MTRLVVGALLLCLAIGFVNAQCSLSNGWVCTGGRIQTISFDDDEMTFTQSEEECTLYQQGEFTVNGNDIKVEFDGLLDLDVLDCEIVGPDQNDCECYEDAIFFEINDDCSVITGPYNERCTAAKVTEDCNFRQCPDGQQLVKDPNYNPTSNGCGASGSVINAPEFSFSECCDQHDFCYGNCTLTKDQCDRNFFQCMHCSCQEEYDGDFFSRQLCEETACLYYQAVHQFGCDAYENSQANGCLCEAEKGAVRTYSEVPSKWGPLGSGMNSRLICEEPFEPQCAGVSSTSIVDSFSVTSVPSLSVSSLPSLSIDSSISVSLFSSSSDNSNSDSSGSSNNNSSSSADYLAVPFFLLALVFAALV